MTMGDIAAPIRLVDTTLRDGAQAPGVVFSDAVRGRIARLLADAGVPELEVGVPAGGPEAVRSVRRLVHAGLPCGLTGWCRARKADLDAAESTGLTAVHLSTGVSPILLGVLGKTCDEMLHEATKAIQDARRRFSFVSVGLQDASRTAADDLVAAAGALGRQGAHRVRLADSVGLWNPTQALAVCRRTKSALPPGCMLGFHAHNDLGMATANTIAAIEGGADSVDVTVNGLGERAGNAALEQVVMAIELTLACSTGVRTESLAMLCRVVSQAVRRPLRPDQPLVGAHAFTHESGIHVWGTLRDGRAYIPVEASRVGREGTRFRYGSQSGRSAIRHALGAAGLSLTDEQIERVRHLVARRSRQAHRSLTAAQVRVLARSLQEVAG